MIRVIYPIPEPERTRLKQAGQQAMHLRRTGAPDAELAIAQRAVEKISQRIFERYGREV